MGRDIPSTHTRGDRTLR